MANFIPLNGLKAGVKACRDDLAALRKINTDLQRATAAITSNTQFAEGWKTVERGKLRETAIQQATVYLEKEQVGARFTRIAAQRPFWGTLAYLRRAGAIPDPDLEAFQTDANMSKLLKTLIVLTRNTNLLLSLQRMNTMTLQAIAAEAVDAGDARTLSAVFTELEARADDDSRRLAYRLQNEAQPPDVVAALALIDEAQGLAELFDYAVQAVTSGDEDLGVRIEQYQKMGEERQRAAERAHFDTELSRERDVLDAQQGNTPAA